MKEALVGEIDQPTIVTEEVGADDGLGDVCDGERPAERAIVQIDGDFTFTIHADERPVGGAERCSRRALEAVRSRGRKGTDLGPGVHEVLLVCLGIVDVKEALAMTGQLRRYCPAVAFPGGTM